MTGSRTRGARLVSLASGRAGWTVLVAVVIVLVAIGSIHRSPTTRASRIAYLDSVIKCPVCEDVSIAASNAQEAVNLRAKVAALVAAGSTNAQVESYVVGQFGTDELLRPSNPVIWILPIAGGACAFGGVATVLVRRRAGSATLALTADDEVLVADALGRSAR